MDATTQKAWFEKIMSLFHWLDEFGIFGAGAVLGPKIMTFFKKGNLSETQVKTVEEVVNLYKEGRKEEAAQLLFKSNLFYVGMEDEALFLFGQIWMIKYFADCGEPDKAELVISAIDTLNPETKKQLKQTLALLEDPTKAGQELSVLAELTDIPAGIQAMCRNAGITAQASEHPANVLATEVANIFDGLGDAHRRAVDTRKDELRRNREERAARINQQQTNRALNAPAPGKIYNI